MRTKNVLACASLLLIGACKKENAPLQSGTITYYHEVNEKIVSVIDVPSAFTPGKDGINDVFRPVLRGCRFDGYEMIIFNASGEKIYITNDKNASWDGNSRGNRSTAGRYFYAVKAIDTTGYRYEVSYGFQLVR